MDPPTNNGAMSGGSHHSPEPPRLCASGCGFYGSAENRGLCSKCYNDYLKENMFKSLPADQLKINNNHVVGAVESSRTDESNDSNNDIIPAVSVTPVVKNRCVMCKKKVGLLGFECRCGGTFCGSHRYPEVHSCKHNFKTVGRIALETENPVCKSEKIRDRI